MWLWLLIQLATPDTFLPAAFAVETSNGPTSEAEAKILWSDGEKAFDQGNYQDAVNDLKRLLDRYPGNTGYLEAHRLLGRALMQLGRYNEAVTPLKAYISAAGDRELGLRTRLWLGDDELHLSKPNEAYLLALEVEKATEKTSPLLYAESQFLKSRALIGLNQDTRAVRVLDSIESAPAVQSDVTLKGYAAQSRIELKLRECAKHPAPGKMNEAQARDQFARRALCLQDALILFKTTAESKEIPTSDSAGDDLYLGFSSYAKATRTPPEPVETKPEKRTAAQKKQYHAEIVDQLEQDRKKALREALGTLAEWGEKASPKAAAAYSRLSRKIESLL